MRIASIPWRRGLRKRNKDRAGVRGEGPAKWSDPIIEQVSRAAQEASALYDEVHLEVDEAGEGLGDKVTVVLACDVRQERLDTPEVNGRRMSFDERNAKLHAKIQEIIKQGGASLHSSDPSETNGEDSARRHVEFSIEGLSSAQARLMKTQVEAIPTPAPIVLRPMTIAWISAATVTLLLLLAWSTSIPVFQLTGVALVGYAVVTAWSKSAALARVVAHPVFAWICFLVGGVNLVPWGLAAGPAPDQALGTAQALVELVLVPVVSAVGIMIAAWSLSEGCRVAEEARVLAGKIAVLDAAIARRIELGKGLDKLRVAIPQLLRSVATSTPSKPEDTPSTHRTLMGLGRQAFEITRAGGIVDQTSEALTLAAAFLGDQRDGRPMRIAAALHSSQEANNDFDPNRATSIRQEIRREQARASRSLKTAAKRTEELEHQTAALTQTLKTITHELEAKELTSRSEAARLRVLLHELEHEAKELRAMIGLAIEPHGSLPRRWLHRLRLERFLGEHDDYGEFVDRIEAQTFDAIRIAQASPLYWMNEARGRPTLLPRRQKLEKAAGMLVPPVLRWAFVVAAAAVLVVLGLVPLLSGSSSPDLLRLLAGLLTAVAPYITIYLSNVRLGSYAFNVAPLLHEQISTKSEALFYTDPKNAALSIERAEKVVRPLPPQEARDYVVQSVEAIKRMAQTLSQIEHREIRTERLEDVEPQTWEELRRESKRLKGTFRDLRTSPESSIRRLREQPTDRRYRYDATVPSDPEQRRELRMKVKQLPFKRLREAFEDGRITNRDIWNMIRDHPSANQSSVFPRDILQGKLFAMISGMVDEADAQGILRPFIGVKDLFAGLDGAANAGSKFTHIADVPHSALVKNLLKLGFLPIPVAMSAGANAGTGLENGHSAVGNPQHLGYDTGGSSSSVAYLLGMEDFPVHLYIGTDTGGSVSAPIGALQMGSAYITKWIPRAGMLPYSTTLDTIGVMGKKRSEVLQTMLSLVSTEHIDLHFTPSKDPPVYYVFESDMKLSELHQDDPLAQEIIEKFGEVVHRLGDRVRWLGPEYDGWREFPLDSYRVSYVEALYTIFNPTQKNHYGEPTRVVLDSNLLNRLGKALLLLKHVLRVEVAQFRQMRLAGKTLFQIFRELRNAFAKVHEERWPKNAVLLQPAPIPIRLEEFKTGHHGGELTDYHDRTGMQKHIHPGWDQFISGEEGYVITGRPEYLMHVLLTQEALGDESKETRATSRNLLVHAGLI
ncbi:MAG: amidase family protein [Myxococcota bacterium]